MLPSGPADSPLGINKDNDAYIYHETRHNADSPLKRKTMIHIMRHDRHTGRQDKTQRKRIILLGGSLLENNRICVRDLVPQNQPFSFGSRDEGGDGAGRTASTNHIEYHASCHASSLKKSTGVLE